MVCCVLLDQPIGRHRLVTRMKKTVALRRISFSSHSSEETLMELGEKVRRAMEKTPTRPHPSAPDTPPANKLLKPGAGLVDRTRDALTGRGKS
jgi:hypothetical protein